MQNPACTIVLQCSDTNYAADNAEVLKYVNERPVPQHYRQRAISRIFRWGRSQVLILSQSEQLSALDAGIADILESISMD